MPNQCYSEYCFHGTQNDLTVLRNTILESMKTDNKLNTLLCYIDPTHKITQTFNKYDTIGNIVSEIKQYNSKTNQYEFCVSTMTAWTHTAKLWKEILNQLNLPDIHFSFYAEEKQAGLYILYDPHNFHDFPELEYVIDYDTNDGQGTDHVSERDAIIKLQFLLNSKSGNIDELIRLADTFENGFIRVSHVDTIDIII